MSLKSNHCAATLLCVLLVFGCRAYAEEGMDWLKVLRIESENTVGINTNQARDVSEKVGLHKLCDDEEWANKPKLKITFYRCDETGGLRRVVLDEISIIRHSPLDRGRQVGPYEPRPYSFCGNNSAGVFGLMSDDYVGENRSQLVEGYQYRISLPGDERCSFFEVPAKPGTGVTYSVSWIIDNAKVPPSAKRPTELWLTGKVPGTCPKDIRNLVVRYAPKEVRGQWYESVRTDGSFKLKVPKLGGMLILGSASDDGTVAWMYKQSVQSTNALFFPKDADLVFERDAMKQCEMVVSGIRLEKKEIGVGMYVDKGDVLPVFYMDLRKPQSVRKMDDGRYMLSFKMGVGKYWAKLHGGDDGRVLAEQEITVNAVPGFQTYTLTVEK